MHNRQAVTPKQLLRSILDYDLWPLYLIGLVAYISTGTVSAYLTLTLKQLGFSTFNTNLLTIPPNVAHIVLLLLQTWATEYFNERSLIATLQPLWIIPCAGVLAFLERFFEERLGYLCGIGCLPLWSLHSRYFSRLVL